MTLWIGSDSGLLRDGDPVAALGDAKIKCLAADDNAVWAATDETLWRYDGDWQEAAAFPDDIRPRYLLPTADSLLVGTSGAHVYRLGAETLERDAAFAGVETRERWHTPWAGHLPSGRCAHHPPGTSGPTFTSADW